MQILGPQITNLLGQGLVIIGGLVLFLSIIGALGVYVFWKTRRIFIPRITLFLVSEFEAFVKPITGLLNIRGDFVDNMITHLRNVIYKKDFAGTPVHQRAVFLPQCLRHPECPATLSTEGINCINCGRCGVGAIKEEAERLGYLFFISPGSSLVKRMVAKYRPKAVLGVGCVMEIKEGTAAMEHAGITSQAVALSKDGCVDTRVDVRKLMNKLYSGIEVVDPDYNRRIEGINNRWTHVKLSVEEKSRAKRQYFEREKKNFAGG